jgi:hypothetical protein
MKVMLDPMIVAASTQGAAALEHGAAAAPTRIIASSHGALTIVTTRLLQFNSASCISQKRPLRRGRLRDALFGRVHPMSGVEAKVLVKDFRVSQEARAAFAA